MSALPKMGTATPYPPRQNSPYMKVDNDNVDDDDDDIYIMMKCVSVTKNHHFPLPS